MVINKSIPLTLFCVLLLSQASTSKTTEDKLLNKACIPKERDALIAFRAGLVDPKNRLSSWKGQDCCQWRGVTCSNTTAHVVRLDFRNTYTQRNYQSEWFIDMSYALSGDIYSPIISLQQLEYLDLSCNNFTDVKIPEFIGSFKELAYLNLSNAEFDGRIPPELGNLSNLQYLDLSNLYDLYIDDITWLTHFSHLTYLDLSSVNLRSVINPKILGTLPHLKTLHLSGCGLDDTNFNLPHVNFTELETLDLSRNSFSNPLSFNWVGNLTNLKYVDFSYNNLMNMRVSYLKNLTNLKDLNLQANRITGDITEFIESLSPHGLQSLDLWYNNFYGNLSSWIGHMTSLSALLLSNNNLSGPIPLSIRKLPQLVEIELSENNFHGTITENHLSKMTSLEYLLLSGNPLNIVIDSNWMPPFRLKYLALSSCHLGPEFPQWLKWQNNSLVLDISGTGIAGEVPTWFWHVFSNSEYLDLSENNLSGVLPESLEFMSTIGLFLNDNAFEGAVPKLSKSLYVLDLSGNAFSGPLSFYTKDLLLGVLILSGNKLNGSIPQSICQMQNLEYLDLSYNFFVGNIPNCSRSNIDSTKKNNSKGDSSDQNIIRQNALKIVILNNNDLSGEFPQHITYWSNLVLLNLNSNNFSSNIPPWIGEKLPSLRMLLLGSNKFSGTIPNQLFELKQLQYLDLSYNNLNGIVPHSLKSLNAMTTNDTTDAVDPMDIVISLNVSGIHMVVTLFTSMKMETKGQVINVDDDIRYFKCLDLSSNNLVGYIPEEIGALVGLRSLNLSQNKLSGLIPTSIGYLQLIECLDLSINRLSGLIPSSLSDLTFLSRLNLSYNNLSGRIPSGHQLQTLDDPSIYEGNNGLCGFPLPVECSENRTTSNPLVSKKQDEYGTYVAVIVGYSIGVCIVYGTLLLTRSWRIYFVFVDNVYDRLYVFLILTWARIAHSKE